MQVQEIGRTDQCDLAEVCALWKQRVECAEVSISGIRVSADDVGLQTESRRECQLFEGITRVGSERPRMDITAAEFAPLENAFEIVVPSVAFSVESRADGMASLVRGSLHEFRARLIET